MNETCVSLFSGIGGLDEGLRTSGLRHLAFCESDAYRRSVLAAHWPGVPIADDVSALRFQPAEGAQGDGRVTFADGAGRLHTIPVPDLLCGGFPCQDLSVAGRRAGLAGERSGLFHEFARIAESLRPRWLLVENVPGLLSSHGGRDFGIVLGTLADIGYGVAWRVLDSRFFGVPQRRRRVYVVGAVADGDPRAAAERAGEVLAVGSRCSRHPATRGEARQDDPAAPVSGTLGGRRGFTGDDIDRGGHTSLSGIGSGGPDDNDAQAGRIVVTGLVKRYGKGTDSDATDTFVVADTVRSHPRPGSNKTPRAGDGGSSRLNQVMVGLAVRRLTPRECERLQGLVDDWTQLDDTPDSKRYSALGDAVTATVSEWIGGRISKAANSQPRGDE